MSRSVQGFHGSSYLSHAKAINCYSDTIDLVGESNYFWLGFYFYPNYLRIRELIQTRQSYSTISYLMYSYLGLIFEQCFY